MPKAIAIDDDMPRRRGRTAEPAKQILLLRLALRSPKDTIAIAFASAAVVAILVNALFMQAGRHPSPLFGTTVTLPPPAAAASQANPLPRARPVEAEARPADAVGSPARSAPPPSAAAPRTAPPATQAGRSDPLASLIVSSQRVAAVQRALTDYGYGQLKATGTIGSDTQTAIQKFERERKLPITGQMSDRLVRELGLVTGRPIE